MEYIQVMWLYTAGIQPIGIVKAWDKIEGRWKFYIGMGLGLDEEQDISFIMACGQKFHSLDHITYFADLTPPY